MTGHPPTDDALAALAARVCEAADTDLASVLRDLHSRPFTGETPAALRAGWGIPELELTTLRDPETA